MVLNQGIVEADDNSRTNAYRQYSESGGRLFEELELHAFAEPEIMSVDKFRLPPAG